MGLSLKIFVSTVKAEKAAAVPDTVVDREEAETLEVEEPVAQVKRPRETSAPVIETPKRKKVKRVHGAVAPAPEEYVARSLSSSPLPHNAIIVNIGYTQENTAAGS